MHGRLHQCANRRQDHDGQPGEATPLTVDQQLAHSSMDPAHRPATLRKSRDARPSIPPQRLSRRQEVQGRQVEVPPDHANAVGEPEAPPNSTQLQGHHYQCDYVQPSTHTRMLAAGPVHRGTTPARSIEIGAPPDWPSRLPHRCQEDWDGLAK